MGPTLLWDAVLRNPNNPFAAIAWIIDAAGSATWERTVDTLRSLADEPPQSSYEDTLTISDDRRLQNGIAAHRRSAL